MNKKQSRLIALLFGVIALTSCTSEVENLVSHEVRSIPTMNEQTLPISVIDHFVTDQMAALEIPGLSVAIISAGQIVYHRSYGIAEVGTNLVLDENSILEAASLSKPVFAYFVLQMAERGLLDLDTPLHTYLPFPELETDRRYELITARMVLSHTSGFPNWRWFDPAPAERNIPRGTMYIKQQPGEFTYSGEAYHYLARVIAHLTGNDMKTLDELMTKEVSDPMGIKSFYWTWDESLESRKVSGHKLGASIGRDWPRSFPDDNRNEIGVAGRLHTEAHGYAQFLIALMNGGRLSESSLDEMLSPQSRVPHDSFDYLNKGIIAWGLGIAIEPTPYGTRYKHGGNNGGFQSGFMFFRNKKLGYVFMANSDRGKEFNSALQEFITVGVQKEP